jgi:hypothetical protein
MSLDRPQPLVSSLRVFALWLSVALSIWVCVSALRREQTRRERRDDLLLALGVLLGGVGAAGVEWWRTPVGLIGAILVLVSSWARSGAGALGFSAPWTKYALGAGGLFAVAAIVWQWFVARAF